MKILPVFLKNNVVNEFYITNTDSTKLVLQQLVCSDEKTFDISRCVIYVNDIEVSFVKGDWTDPHIFYVNGIQNKIASQVIKPFSLVKFKLCVICDEHEKKKIENIDFQLHLALEEEAVSLSA